MDTDTAITKVKVQYCPLCGYKSKKKFATLLEHGGDWLCENCDERVKAYVLLKGEDVREFQYKEERVEKEYTGIPLPISMLLGIVLLIIFVIIF